jgi:hypothetical protein
MSWVKFTQADGLGWNGTAPLARAASRPNSGFIKFVLTLALT